MARLPWSVKYVADQIIYLGWIDGLRLILELEVIYDRVLVPLWTLVFDSTGRGDRDITMLKLHWFDHETGTVKMKLLAVITSLKKGITNFKEALHIVDQYLWYKLAPEALLSILTDNASGARKVVRDVCAGCDLHVCSLFVVRGILNAFGQQGDMHAPHVITFGKCDTGYRVERCGTSPISALVR